MEEFERYFSPEGEPITMLEWSTMFEARKKSDDRSWWQRRTEVDGGVSVSTVWLGLNHQFGDGPPLFWETMIFGGDHDEDQWRYSSKEGAFEDHDRIVAALQCGEDPNLRGETE